MRMVIGCLAVIGLVALLVIGGCAGLIGFGVAQAMKPLPTYATKADIGRRHGEDLRLISEALAQGNLASVEPRLSPAVLAIIRQDTQEHSDTQDVLRRHPISSQSWRVINGGGVGTLTSKERTLDCEVISVDDPRSQGDSYLVFFLDRQAGAVERP